MLLLQTNQLSKSFLTQSILSNINIQIQSLERIGLVGVNGAGKSTLLKILAKEMLHDSGEIHMSKGTSIGYLAQDSGLDSNLTIWQEMLSVFTNIIAQEGKIRDLEEQMSRISPSDSTGQYVRLMNIYAKEIEFFKENGGYSYEAKIRGVLHGLGFQHFDFYSTSISALSGGQKTRLAMAKVLLTEPDILMLDEPTNYLDMQTLTWLEGYLKNYSGAILVVSHDRYFLDQLVNIIYEIERTEATRYVGNYSQYIEQKSKNIELEMKKYEKQQAEIAKLEDFIQKNIARATTTRRAQSRRKTLEKIEKLDKPIAGQKRAFFTFDIDKMSGNQVLQVNQLAMGFENQKLFENVSFHIERGERVAIIGPNGTGKSTLLKLITNKLKPQNGTITYGSNVEISYYDQEQNELHLEKTIIDELWDDYPTLTEKEVRTLLGNFLFINDDVFKKIKSLSGGERARVSLAKLMLKKGNLLLLDEPTNHLDIFSREVLENALVDYPGTILFISHDRYFLNRLTTRTLELTKDGIQQYLGDYSYYLEKKAELAEETSQMNVAAISPEQKDRPKTDKEHYENTRERQKVERQLNRKIQSVEEDIEATELKIGETEEKLLDPEIYMNHELANETNQSLIMLKEKLEKLMDTWAELQKELELI